MGRAASPIVPSHLRSPPVASPAPQGHLTVVPRLAIEWRLDKAQQNGAFLRKWPQMLIGGTRKPGSIPCQLRFPCAGWVSTGRAISPSIPPVFPLYTPCIPPVTTFYFYRGALQGDYRGYRGGLLGN